MIVVLGGCTFHPGGNGGSGDDAAIGDSGGGGDAAGSDASPITATCGAPDRNGLVLCFELDDSGVPAVTTLVDGSDHHHDATASHLSLASRNVPTTSQALQVISQTVVQTADSADFDVQAFTLMAWVRREGTLVMNGGGVYGLIDAGGQYRMAINDSSQLECLVASPTIVTIFAGADVPQNQWELAACTYDGSQLCEYVFDGANADVSSACFDLAGPVLTTPIQGVAIGSAITASNGHTDQLAGKLDSARVFSRALTEQQLCVGGGLTGC